MGVSLRSAAVLSALLSIGTIGCSANKAVLAGQASAQAQQSAGDFLKQGNFQAAKAEHAKALAQVEEALAFDRNEVVKATQHKELLELSCIEAETDELVSSRTHLEQAAALAFTTPSYAEIHDPKDYAKRRAFLDIREGNLDDALTFYSEQTSEGYEPGSKDDAALWPMTWGDGARIAWIHAERNDCREALNHVKAILRSRQKAKYTYEVETFAILYGVQARCAMKSRQKQQALGYVRSVLKNVSAPDQVLSGDWVLAQSLFTSAEIASSAGDVKTAAQLGTYAKQVRNERNSGAAFCR